MHWIAFLQIYMFVHGQKEAAVSLTLAASSTAPSEAGAVETLGVRPALTRLLCLGLVDSPLPPPAMGSRPQPAESAKG